MRLKIIALLLIVGGAAQAMPPVTNSYEVRRWAIYPAMQQPTFYALQVDGHEYLVMWQYDERSFTHSGSCTNHAPVVVTNTVYVTNECTRQHCSPTNMTCGAWKQMIYNDVTNAVEK